jgi:hypothetical protein
MAGSMLASEWKYDTSQEKPKNAASFTQIGTVQSNSDRDEQKIGRTAESDCHIFVLFVIKV